MATSVVLSACKNNENEVPVPSNVIDGQGEMTYRINHNTGDKVSLLGYGMMRLPIENGADMRKDPNARVDQEMVNQEVDYAFLLHLFPVLKLPVQVPLYLLLKYILLNLLYFLQRPLM